MMDKEIVIDGIAFRADKDGCISIIDNIDKISTLIPFLTMLQRNGYEELYLYHCQDIIAIPKENRPL